MPELNPYYAHPSPVGDVFDVATWSPGKNFSMGLMGIVSATLLGIAAACVWDPVLLQDYAPDFADNLARENRKLADDYPYATPAIISVLGVLSYVFLGAGVTAVTDAMRSNCYFRSGPGGISLRLPNGVSLAKLGLGSQITSLNLPWSEIVRWSITQRKQFGALSANAGNIGGHIDILLRDGRKYRFSLDTLREPARIIYNRIEESKEMRTALSTTAAALAAAAPAPASDVHRFTGEEKYDAVVAALEGLLQQNINGAAALFSDHATGRFVQFVQLNGALLLDLPTQSLRGEEKKRAADYFRRLAEPEPASDEAGGAPARVAVSAVSTSRSLQVNFAQDASRAAEVTLEVLHDVLSIPKGFELEIEQF